MSFLRRILLIILIIVFLYYFLLTANTLYGYYTAKTSHDEGRELVSIPETIKLSESAEPPQTLLPDSEDPLLSDPVFQAVKDMSLESIQKINSDVVGWIIIPDTKISYPILQNDDNSYYLTHTWKMEENRSGSVFLDFRCSEDFDGFNTILYGHRMANGSMFAPLAKYADEDFFNKHLSVYIVTENSFKKYEVFSAYEAHAHNGHTYKLDFDTEEAKNLYLDFCVSKSCHKSEFLPTTDTKTITLSTCTGRVDDYTKRWVVHAALVLESDILKD